MTISLAEPLGGFEEVVGERIGLLQALATVAMVYCKDKSIIDPSAFFGHTTEVTEALNNPAAAVAKVLAKSECCLRWDDSHTLWPFLIKAWQAECEMQRGHSELMMLNNSVGHALKIIIHSKEIGGLPLLVVEQAREVVAKALERLFVKLPPEAKLATPAIAEPTAAEPIPE